MHPTAVFGQDVILASDVSLAPFVVLGDRVRIGARTRVHDGVCIEDDVEIGSDCELQVGCVVLDHVRIGNGVNVGPNAVVGADGFGFVEDQGIHHKIPQVGTVVIGDGVTIAAAACIDRGTTTETVIGAKTRIGTQAQVGHNVRIGANCTIGAQAGIAGSCTIEDDCRLGDAVGTVPHQIVRRGVVAEARTGITKEVAAGSHIAGYPFRPVEEHRWLQEQLGKVPALVARIAELEKALGIVPPDPQPPRQVSR